MCADAPTIELSDADSEDDASLALRLQAEERTLASRIARRILESDVELANRLQEEERAQLHFPHPFSRFGAGLPRGFPGASRFGDLHFGSGEGAMHDMFGQQDAAWRSSNPPLLPAHMPPLHPGSAAGRGPSGGGRNSQLAHLSLMNRDFGEADYEMLLRLDETPGG